MGKSLYDFSDGSEDDLAMARLHEKVAQRDRKIAGLEKAVRQITSERDDLALEREAFFDDLAKGQRKPPTWTTAKRAKHKRHATPVLMLSDLHFDEVVDPKAMHYLNAYNREIAEIRFRHTIEMACELPTEYFTGLNYDGIVVLCGGDWWAGWIHPELVETNDGASILDGLVHWTPIVAGALQRLADVYGRVATYWTWGNHGRISHGKPKFKGAARDNIEWVMAHQIRQLLRDDKRITFVIPDAMDVMVPVYDTRIRLEHGNLGMRGGSGIAGALSPLLLGVHRATRQATWEQRPFDVLMVGHWHQETFIPSRGLCINGSMVGYDEFARGLKLEPELAKQSLVIVTPEHGVSFSAPIICQDRNREGW